MRQKQRSAIRNRFFFLINQKMIRYLIRLCGLYFLIFLFLIFSWVQISIC
eukprot:UN26984